MLQSDWSYAEGRTFYGGPGKLSNHQGYVHYVILRTSFQRQNYWG